MDTGGGSGAGDDAARDAAAAQAVTTPALAAGDGKAEEEVAAEVAAAELARFQEAYGALDVRMSGPVEGVPEAVTQLTVAVERAIAGDLPEACLNLLVSKILPESLEGVLKRQLSQVRFRQLPGWACHVLRLTGVMVRSHVCAAGRPLRHGEGAAPACSRPCHQVVAQGHARSGTAAAACV